MWMKNEDSFFWMIYFQEYEVYGAPGREVWLFLVRTGGEL